MRYPGPYRHERLVRVVILFTATVLFVVGLAAASAKQRRLSAHSASSIAHRTVPAPTPTDDATAVLRLADFVTGQPLSGRSVALMLLASCPAGGACPASTPSVLTADASGKIIVPQSVLRQQPKLYISGYRLDSYFAFLSSDKPDEVTIYQAYDDAKLVYDIDIEEVPIWLTPMEAQ